ncbi:MAG: hypothetical protein GF418_15385 [Chitinivibrionales bacterium]|nr:hypothetical protein [Chitinivibrionales bacterium]MBD3397005.1 hypothetical protein [Chitinivibrionales bacterium]
MSSIPHACFAVIAVAFAAAVGSPELSFDGYLDSDVWTNFGGDFFTNDELDLGMGISFSDRAQAHIYATVTGGSVPAGRGEPGPRWVDIAFDGVDITFSTGIGSFAVGDLVYQYGGFNYYLYKRGNMITPESFTRGVRYSIGNDRIRQAILIGAADEPDVLLEHSVATAAGDTLTVEAGVAAESNAGDIGGYTEVSFTEATRMSLFYGLRADPKRGFEATGHMYGGLEFTTAVGEVIAVKADIGLQSFVSSNTREDDFGRSTTVPLLLEPSLSVGRFTTALSAYYVFDPDTTGNYMDAGEQMFVYVEPGFAFNDYVAAGLPLEMHTLGEASDLSENSEFWATPTCYVYPAKGMEWWVWFGAYVPLETREPYYGAGSELIVEF